jgi:hypothetical protein
MKLIEIEQSLTGIGKPASVLLNGAIHGSNFAQENPVIVSDGQAIFDGDSKITIPHGAGHISVANSADGFLLGAHIAPDVLLAESPILYKQGEYLFKINSSGKLAGYVYDGEGDYLGQVSASVLPSAVEGNMRYYGMRYKIATKTIELLSLAFGDTDFVISSVDDNNGSFGTEGSTTNDLYMGYDGSNYLNGLGGGVNVFADEYDLGVLIGYLNLHSDDIENFTLWEYIWTTYGETFDPKLFATLKTSITDLSGYNPGMTGA